MCPQKRANGWTWVVGCLLLAAGCETKPLPAPTSASAVPSAVAPPTPKPFVLDPAFLADRPDEYTAPRRVLARIQSNLERVAAGKEPSNVPQGIQADPLETFVLAYQSFIKGEAGAAESLARVAKLAHARLDKRVASAKRQIAEDHSYLPAGHELETYAKLVSEMANAPVKNADDLMIRLVTTMRIVDTALLVESGNEAYDASYDPFERHDEFALRPIDEFRDAMWLRLPCQTILTQRKSLEAAHKRLAKIGGPLLSCPAPAKGDHDFDFMERFAKSPGETAASVIAKPPAIEEKNAPAQDPVAPPPPWNWQAAILFMDENPDAADKPLAAEAAKSAVGKLNYALFLHAFRPASKTRDDTIKKLMAEVDKASIAAAKKADDEFLIDDRSIGRRDYDGTDESLIGSIRLASSTGAAMTSSAFYAIPCAILLRRAKLLDATEPLFGGNRDNFLPRAGCSWGRGFIKGFPSVELDNWRNAAEEADGKFLFNFSGTMRFAIASGMNLEAETLSTNPRKLLEGDLPKQAWPYETWSYMTPESRTIYKELLGIAQPLKDKLVAHYKTRGISAEDAEKMAHAGLFRVVFGASCGKAPPPRSMRKLVVDGASPDEIRAFVVTSEYKKDESLTPFRECAEKTGIDPLIHMAVLNPEVMPVLWELFPRFPEDAKNLDVEVDPNTPNAFGKTPLMVAAQQDQVKAAKILLDHGAALERTTFKQVLPTSGDNELAHDARTALMYAAARGSLEMIRLLLDRGADKYAADTQGRRALHYLLGKGPVAANPKLSATEIADAAKLLY